MVEKKKLNWKKIGFGYHKTDFRFVSVYKNGKWSEGKLIRDNQIQLHEGSSALHYAQQCFEGMKAHSAADGRVLLFRPLENAKRMQNTARRLLIPPVPDALFLRAVEEVIRANLAWLPPYGSGASLYIRPLLFGSGAMLGLMPAPTYEFRVFASPVGPYFSEQKLASIKLYLTTKFDRAAPLGIGAFKAGANYAAGLFVKEKAKEKGADEALFLDAREHKYLDETGASNIVIFTKDQRLITPSSDTILPSITRESIMQIAAEKLGLKTQERAIDFFDEAETFAEMGACGTAAVLTPISEIITDKTNYVLQKNNPVMQKIYQELVSIQQGQGADSFDWVHEVALKC